MLDSKNRHSHHSVEIDIVHQALLLVPQVGRHVQVLLVHRQELLDLLQTLDLLVVAVVVARLHDLGVITDHHDGVSQLQQEAVCRVLLDELVDHLEDGCEVVVDLLIVDDQRFL